MPNRKVGELAGAELVPKGERLGQSTALQVPQEGQPGKHGRCQEGPGWLEAWFESHSVVWLSPCCSNLVEWRVLKYTLNSQSSSR